MLNNTGQPELNFNTTQNMSIQCFIVVKVFEKSITYCVFEFFNLKYTVFQNYTNTNIEINALSTFQRNRELPV